MGRKARRAGDRGRPARRDYAFPGNVRELEQCVRSFLVRGDYVPPSLPPSPPPSHAHAASRTSRPELELELDRTLLALDLTADELLNRCCAAQYVKRRSFKAVAQRIGRDWRTVKSRAGGGLAAGDA